MSTPKHTLGPLRVVRDMARNQPRVLIVNANGDEIAAINPHHDNCIENANLFASAPELAESLRECVDWRIDLIMGHDTVTDAFARAAALLEWIGMQ